MSKYAILLNTSTDDVGPTANGFEYAIDLDRGGHDVDLFFDGVATRWPGQLVEKPDHPINKFFEEAEERGLVAGACGFCADSFGGAEGCEKAGVEILGSPDEHAPKPSELIDEGYELLTVG